MAQHQKVNVLLVDDQPAKLLSYEVILRDLNENLIKALSAREALEHLLKSDVAVILIDVCMPELDGFQLAAMIRDHPRFQNIAIIFISAIQVTDADRLRGFAMGAVDYVPVPVVPEVLRAKVKVFAELHRKTRELEKLNAELESRVAERTRELEASTKRLLQSERLRSLALASGQMGSWDWDADKKEFNWDEGQSRIFGIDPQCAPSFRTLRSVIHPDDWPHLKQMLGGLAVDAQACQTEFRVQQPSGDLRWCIGAAAASVSGSNRIARISGVTVDITDQKQADERRALLVREVDHRARNALAVVQSIVRLTKAGSIDAYKTAVEGRIRALSTAHSLLSESRWEGAHLSGIVNEELAPYRRPEVDRIFADGPSILLQPSVAQIMAVVLHELATNAAKYGALSTASGTLTLNWVIAAGDLVLTWREAGGPPVQAPQSRGYGAKVITAGVERQLEGSVEFDWRPQGLRFTMTIPLGETVAARTGAANGKAEAKSAPRPQRATIGGNRLLLVEDEVLVGIMMRNALSELGFQVIGPLDTMLEAAEAVRNETFHAAILDVNLKGELIYPLADMIAARGVPFAFVTGYGAESVERRFAHVPILQKPIELDRLQTIFDIERPEETSRTGSLCA
jgi:PAS domain S-box-containing protein